MKAHGGLLSLQDLQNYRTQHNEPLWGEYRGHRIATNHPPGGGVTVIEMLNILENFDLRAMGHNSPEYIRVVSEAMKRSEEHTSELQSLMRISYAVFCLKKKINVLSTIESVLHSYILHF